MTKLIDKIVAALDEGNDQVLLQDVSDLPRAMARLYVISKEGENAVREQEEFNFPYYEELKNQILTDEEAARLKSALMKYVERNSGDYVPIALWTLGYFFDQGLIGFLRSQLQKHLDLGASSFDALGQCIIALSTIGEDILLEGSFAAHEHARNVEMAQVYLETHRNS